VQCQVIKPICDLLATKDAKLIKVLLDGLCNILLVAEKVGQLEQARIHIEEIDGLVKIEKLQENENEEVYKLAYHMVEKFFSDEDAGDEGLQPEATREQYTFAPALIPAASSTNVTSTTHVDAAPAAKFSF